MYEDLVQKVKNQVKASTLLFDTFGNAGMEEFNAKLRQVKDMVCFGKYDLCKHHMNIEHDTCALHCVPHCLGGCEHCNCPGGVCTDACHPDKCDICERFLRWGVNMQQFFVGWKNKIEKVYESDLNDIEPSLVKEQMLLLLQSSCQICKQYAYVPKYFRAHNGRALWEGHACAKLSKQLLSHELNPTRSNFLLRTDHWSKQLPSKTLTPQGYDRGLRGMSTQGFQIEFASGIFVN
jgi:hypothetical protein